VVSNTHKPDTNNKLKAEIALKETIMKKLLLAIAVAGCSMSLWADTLALKKDHPDSYVVKQGDTLWDISGTFLDEPWRWPEIWKINPQVEDPHWIYPGDKLSLVYVAGENGEKEPRLVVSDRAPIKVSPNSGDTGNGKLQPQLRTAAISSSIPAIPLEKISAFLSKSRVVTVDELNAAPYVIAGDSKHILSGAGDKLYARGAFKKEEPIYGIFRSGHTYIDPETKEVLGLQARDIGGGRVIDITGDVAALTINETHEEIRINDRLLPSENKKVDAMFYPKSPSKEIKGSIIDVEGGVSQVGAMDIVAINQGEREGLEVGDVLAITQTGEVVRDRVKDQLIRLPDVRAGLLIVFRTFPKLSFGLVVSSNRPLRVGDKVKNP
jgi:nucleoid-associated protein YgaU